MERMDDDEAFQAFRDQLREHLKFLEQFEAKLASGEAVVAPADRESIQTSIAEFRLYLELTEDEDKGPAIERIVRELARLRADEDAVGPTDAIHVSDRGNGNAVIQGSPRTRDFNWFGPTKVILERLSELPDEAGPEAIRSEFHEGI